MAAHLVATALLGLQLAQSFAVPVTSRIEGPQWQTTFQCKFDEVIFEGQTLQSKNKGAWYYDFAHKRARFDHLQGQKNNFCSNQNLSDANPTDDCHLIFDPSGQMFVHYPNAKTCCGLCDMRDPDILCTPLTPTWIQDGTFQGIENVAGAECEVWVKKGAVAMDYWLQQSNGLPCRYHETLQFPGIPIINHNLTFDPSTYDTIVSDLVFDVPPYCHNLCPRPFGSSFSGMSSSPVN